MSNLFHPYSYLLEETTQTLNDLKIAIEKSFNRKFKNAYFDVWDQVEPVVIEISLGINRREYLHGQQMNDPMYEKFFIKGFNESGNQTGDIVISGAISGAKIKLDASNQISYAPAKHKVKTIKDAIKYFDKAFDSAYKILKKYDIDTPININSKLK